MWNLGVVSWLYGNSCTLENIIGYHFSFDVLREIVAKNQLQVKVCGFYDRFTLIFD